jgi:hypothetical protein
MEIFFCSMLDWMRGRDLQEREGKGKKRPLLLRSAPQVKGRGWLR